MPDAADHHPSEGFVGVPFQRSVGAPAKSPNQRYLNLTLLLRCAGDLEYNPPTWSSTLRRQSIAGEGPSERIDCNSCQGQGEIRRRGVPFLCEACAGRGWIVVDAYTRRIVGTEETGTVNRVKAVRCDACAGNGAHGNQQRCQVCRGSGWVEVPLSRLAAVRAPLSADAPELGAGDPVLACLERRERAGDFEQLGLALAALRLELPRSYRTVVRVYVEAVYEVEDLAPYSLLAHDVGIAYVLRLMPQEIRVPSWAARNERRRRERLKRKRSQEAAA